MWLWGVIVPKGIISRPFTYTEQNESLQILIGCVSKIMSVVGWLPSNLSWLFQRAVELFNFQLSEQFLKFLSQLLRCKVPWSKKKYYFHIVFYLGGAIALPMLKKQEPRSKLLEN